MRLVLALLVLLALPGAASASTVSVVLADGCQGDVACSKYGGAPPVPITVFEGGPGEANLLAVRRDGGSFVLRDDGAPLAAEAPCTAIDAHAARCPVTEGSGGVRGFAASLGDGDDRLRIAGDLRVEASIASGAGNDVIEAGAENDTVDGGRGGDRLLGGGGTDELSYTARTAPVVVDLAGETGGELGEDDGVAGFETVVGGAGDDILNGSARPEVLDGGTGDDLVLGSGGDDALFGGLGADMLWGQRGDDRLFGDPAQGDDVYTPIVKLRADVLDGGRGDDLLNDTGGRNVFLGGFGDDVIELGAGRETVVAGPGGDRVFARGGGRDRVDCGGGRDRAWTDRRDSRRSCERR